MNGSSNGQPIRAIGQKVTVYEAVDIERVGFGSTEITQRVGEALVTETHMRLFRVSCGDVVASHTECAPPCCLCLDELVKSQQCGDIAETFNEPELIWLATPCVAHHRACAFSFCGLSGCHKHMARAGDGKHYCRTHFLQVENELHLAKIREEYGPVRAGVSRFFRSLIVRR